jgi:anti-sigma B factor antagonist
MIVHVREIGEVSVVEVEGRITTEETADTLRDTFMSLIQRGRLKLVVNLQHVPSIDTTGLSEILRAYTSVTKRSGGLKLVKLSPHVRRVLEITRLLTILEAFDDEAGALESLSKVRAVGAS